MRRAGRWRRVAARGKGETHLCVSAGDWWRSEPSEWVSRTSVQSECLFRGSCLHGALTLLRFGILFFWRGNQKPWVSRHVFFIVIGTWANVYLLYPKCIHCTNLITSLLWTRAYNIAAAPLTPFLLPHRTVLFAHAPHTATSDSKAECLVQVDGWRKEYLMA